MKTDKPRKPNTPAVVGMMKHEIGAAFRPDVPEYDKITINAAHDGQLADALALRGYDVIMRVPSDKTIARRAKQYAAIKARQDAARAK
jgi:hypothetical protein